MAPGRAVRFAIDVAINQDLKAIFPAKALSTDFLHQWLRAREEDIAARASGSTVKGIRLETLRAVPFLLPPLPEQRKIAAILSSVDDTIEASQAVIDQLQVVKKAMMAELLTKGLPGRHKKFKQTEIGQVPEEWEPTRLGDICDRMFVGIAQAATHAYVPTGGVPIVRTTNLRENIIRHDDLLKISRSFATEMQSKRLRKGDVLTARTGYPGTSAVVSADLDGAQCFTLLVSRPGPKLAGRFLSHVMNSHIGQRIVARGQAGGAQQNLNVGVFQEAVVFLPSLNEQEVIADQLDVFYERLAIEQEEIEKHVALKSALMSVLLTGEVRVRVDEEAAA
jgi:type I restriction enzyme S subunit